MPTYKGYLFNKVVDGKAVLLVECPCTKAINAFSETDNQLTDCIAFNDMDHFQRFVSQNTGLAGDCDCITILHGLIEAVNNGDYNESV